MYLLRKNQLKVEGYATYQYLFLSFFAVRPKTDAVDGLITLKRDRYIYHTDYQNHSSAMFTELSSTFCENVSPCLLQPLYHLILGALMESFQ